MKDKITLEQHYGITVLRDDLLIGGTKSILMPHIVKGGEEFIYASTVYGGFQIALAAHCKKIGKKATIFCAKRGELFINTKIAQDYGAKIIEVPDGMLTVVEKRARDYAAAKPGRVKLEFGGATQQNKVIIAERAKKVFAAMGREPKQIWCAVGSATLLESLLIATKRATIHGVITGGRAYTNTSGRVFLYTYPKPFGWSSKFDAGFPSMPNYDLKAFEYCVRLHEVGSSVLFWNVHK